MPSGMAGAWQCDPARATLRIALVGAALVAVELFLHPVLPINKKLWTSSFAIFTSGSSALLLALCMAATRGGIPRLLAPLRMLGMHAIFGYVLSSRCSPPDFPPCTSQAGLCLARNVSSAFRNSSRSSLREKW